MIFRQARQDGYCLTGTDVDTFRLELNMQNHQLETAIEESSTAAAVGLACNVCRKSKLRCSRDKPACQHCRKTGVGPKISQIRFM